MELIEGWEVASVSPGAVDPRGDLAGLDWRPARVPGTAASAVGADGRDFDAEDWLFRTRFPASTDRGPTAMLELDGIATVSEVYLNGELVLESDSMWLAHRVDVGGRLRADNELLIVCRALAPLLALRRRPSARWRTRVVNHNNLRWFRTMSFGRSPGFAPGPAAVGPWRPVRLVLDAPFAAHDLSVRASLDNDTGVVTVRVAPLRWPAHAELRVDGVVARLEPTGDGRLAGEARVERVRRWWPHTHGEPALYEVSVAFDGEIVARRQVGFRALRFSDEIPVAGLELELNGVPVFARGAVWTPADLISLAPDDAALRHLLELVRDAGMNMLRVVGTGAYESPRFHDLCDELGILVWQDLMFSNVDYPLADPEFRAGCEREARQLLYSLGGRPSLTVVCGNSEVEQQPAMMGLDAGLGRDEFWERTLPELVAESGVDCAYVASTPCGGDLPFHSDRGIAHYFEVSGYFWPVERARRANVRFAAECLAFANVPDTVEVPVHHPRWKEGVPRDAGTGWDLGAGWDFDDVRDFYLGSLFEVDPVQLRRSDLMRYLELARAASGEVMAEVVGEWRRAGSPCRGALVLWLKDMLPGAGLGVVDHDGRPKVAYHYLRRAFAPVAVWMTDEGVNGVAIHLANDRSAPFEGRLRLGLYHGFEARVDEVSEQLSLSAHTATTTTVERMLGRFVDAAWAYRFGPPAQDVIVASLESADGGALHSQAFRFPAGLPSTPVTSAQLGLEATAVGNDAGYAVRVRSRRLAYAVRVHARGFVADDDAFSVEPGGERVISLRLAGPAVATGFTGTVTALNARDGVKIDADRT
jgi:beta-mannosidase